LDVNAEAVRNEAAALGGNALAIAADVADEHSIGAAFARAREACGRIDSVVNYAGINRQVPILSMSLEDWNAVIRVNLTGSFLVARAAAEVMKPQGVGSIVLVSSRLYLGGVLNVNYISSKGGVVALARSLALRWEKHNIRV